MIGLSFGIRNPIKIIGGGGGGGGFDLDALAYITAANITDTTERTAINNFVIELKARNMWDKIYAFYPLLGNTLAQTTYNLKDPALYQITWTGSPTLVAKGLQFDGTTQHGDTNFSPITVPGFNQADFMFGCYDGTGFNARTEVPMGITERSGERRARAVWFNNNQNILDIWSNNAVGSRVNFVDGNGQRVGHWVFERRNLTDVRAYSFLNPVDGFLGNQNFNSSSAETLTNKMFLAATSDGDAGANTVGLRSNKLYKYFYMSRATSGGSQLFDFANAIYNFTNAVGK